MKLLHRPDLYGWSQFDANRNIDFNSVLWVRHGGNVTIDPLPLSLHDAEHLEKLGSVRHIIITNSDHVRDANRLRERTGAMVYAPAAEQGNFTIPVDHWLKTGQEPIPGLRTYEMAGSKTPGELALLLESTTLITGDLIRAHSGGQLDILPASKLTDVTAAIESVQKLSRLDGIVAVLPGDGWPVFTGGTARLRELAAQLQAAFGEQRAQA
jgi:glyoxylase-like metal-dependent hydrolase (beta-lactamase superfamily II)